jgi:hypothetical protein
MEKATGEYVLIIGEDTLLLKDSFSRMLHHLGGASNRGMVVPLANHALGTQKIPGAEDLSVDEFSEYAADLGKRSLFRRPRPSRRAPSARSSGANNGSRRPLHEDIASPFFVTTTIDCGSSLRGIPPPSRPMPPCSDGIPRQGKDVTGYSMKRGTPSAPARKKGRGCAFVATKNARDHFRKGSLERAMNALSEGMRISPDEPRIYIAPRTSSWRRNTTADRRYDRVRPAAESSSLPTMNCSAIAHTTWSAPTRPVTREGALACPRTPGAFNLLGLWH